MLSEEKVIDKIEILENGAIQIREATRVVKDGATIAETYHRYCLMPGENTDEQPAKVRAVCAAAWTNEVIDAYHSSIMSLPGMPGMPA